MDALTGKSPRVLVVEDDADLANAVGNVLEEDGFTVQLALHGDDALAVLEHWMPDAIVLDHNLPVMTGEQFLQEIRWRPVLSRVPVLLVSALDDVETIARRLRLRYFLHKPFASRALSEMVRRMIASRFTAKHRFGGS